MGVRRRCLPAGWYPGTAHGVRDAVQAMLGPSPPRRSAVAGVAPHAGWEFSGALACAVFASLAEDLDTIVIIGGHLAPADGILCAFDAEYETPLGNVSADLELASRLKERVPMAEDRWAYNTVEVQLPFARLFFPTARCLGMRAPPSPRAGELGRAIAEVARATGIRVGVVGSTDLTHYGPNYGFEPAGSGKKAVEWVTGVNDRRFIDALLAMDEAGARQRAAAEHSACSAGGAVAAMAFAREAGVSRGELLDYRTSRDVHPLGRESPERPAESFVGYAAVVYRKEA
ncbi:MAG: AmmeMemoRadiSam system protein B [Spirochaetes bacterium RBG_13_68_11]|nr:MAG: AmmeMemoRadiSam system protein B [Spirochaetes bacterium RBG_13_68_11]